MNRTDTETQPLLQTYFKMLNCKKKNPSLPLLTNSIVGSDFRALFCFFKGKGNKGSLTTENDRII